MWKSRLGKNRGHLLSIKELTDTLTVILKYSQDRVFLNWVHKTTRHRAGITAGRGIPNWEEERSRVNLSVFSYLYLCSSQSKSVRSASAPVFAVKGTREREKISVMSVCPREFPFFLIIRQTLNLNFRQASFLFYQSQIRLQCHFSFVHAPSVNWNPIFVVPLIPIIDISIFDGKEYFSLFLDLAIVKKRRRDLIIIFRFSHQLKLLNVTPKKRVLRLLTQSRVVSKYVFKRR